MSDASTRVMVIGLDGATMDLIEPWAKEGSLPNLGRLMKSGVSGRLASTIPPFTPIAWTSMTTGVNAGKHGVFDFFRTFHEEGERSFVTSQERRAEPIWSMLSRKGKKVCVMGVPITNPPDPVNGIMLSCSVDTASVATYPKKLLKELEEKYGDLPSQLTQPNMENPSLKWFEKQIEVTNNIALDLLAREKWDFFMVVLSYTDHAGHYFWHLHDPNSPFYSSAMQKSSGNVLKEVYKVADTTVGELKKCAGEDVATIILSDHGMGPYKKDLHVNHWLEANGFLKFKFTHAALEKNLHHHMKRFDIGIIKGRGSGVLRPMVRGWTEGIPGVLKGQLDRGMLNAAKKYRLTVDIDWERTSAYAVTGGLVRINLKGREPHGIVEPGEEYEKLQGQIIERIKGLSDPSTGKKLVKYVERKQKILKGPMVDGAPDIFMLLSDESYRPTIDCIPIASVIDRPGNTKISGVHTYMGMIILQGEPFEKGKEISGASLLDLVPTILPMYNMKIPSDIDGKARKEVFKKGYLARHPVEISKEKTQVPSAKGHMEYSQKDKEIIEDRLRSLGYIG